MTDPTTPVPAGAFPVSNIRHGLSVADLKQSFLDNLFCGLGRVPMARDAATTLTPRWR